MRPGTTGLSLHGGGKPFDPAQYYTVDGGNIRTGLVAVQWALVDHVARPRWVPVRARQSQGQLPHACPRRRERWPSRCRCKPATS